MATKANIRPIDREIGSKLWKFRQYLDLKQKEFGQKFSSVGGQGMAREFSQRMINGYESGENELSGELLWNIWKAGFSIDLIFAEQEQDLNKITARGLLEHAIHERQGDYRSVKETLPQETPGDKKPRAGTAAPGRHSKRDK